MGGDCVLRWTARENGLAVIRSFAGERAVFTNQIDTADAEARAAFVQELCRRCPGFDPDTLTQEMERIAGEVAGHYERKAQATLLVELAGVAELFHTPGADAEAYAVVPDGARKEATAVRSTPFRRWLRHQFWQVYGKAIGEQVVASAVETLASRAVIEGPEHPVWARVAEHGLTTYLDLADAERRVVEIDADGWRIVTDPPVYFVRPRGMLPLPVPERRGSLADLRAFSTCGTRRGGPCCSPGCCTASAPRAPTRCW